MRRLTGRERILVCTAALTAIAFVCCHMLVIPGNNSYAQAKTRLDELQSRKAVIDADISRLEAQKSGCEHSLELFQNGQKAFDQVTDGVQAELKILEYLENHHIKPEKTSVGVVEERQLTDNHGTAVYIYAVSVKIRASGGWNDFSSLMDQVSHDPRMRLISFEAEEVDQGTFDQGGNLNISMDMEYYMLNSQKSPGSAAGKREGS